MILKGSQRGGAKQLAVHLLRLDENDHVEVVETRGFVSRDLAGALSEAHAISLATNCKQFMFSLSLNPPRDADASRETLLGAADRAGEALGLAGQPRAIVIHEKNGRRHAHVVWSRIDADTLTAVPLPFFKNRLTALSKELYLENGWDLPDGLKENGWKSPLNFTRGEWEQAKQLDLDPRELKQLFRDSWRESDGFKSFRAALEDRGYFLAKGDKRGFVALDVHGAVYSVARFAGVKTKELEARLGSPDRLESVDAIRAMIDSGMARGLRTHLKEFRKSQKAELAPLAQERTRMVAAQRVERARMRLGQRARLVQENRERQARLRRGIGGVWDILTGRAAIIRRENDREAFEGYRRDLAQREALFRAQRAERAELQSKIAELRATQRQDLMRRARQVARVLRAPQQAPGRKGPRRNFDLGL